MLMRWGDFRGAWGQQTISKLTDGVFAAQARDHGLISPESSLYTAIPEHTTQPISVSETATGVPFRFVNPATGQVNWPVVGLAALGVAVLIKAVRK